MSKTVVGLFTTTAQAQQVKQTLITKGYDSSDIKIVANDHSEGHAEQAEGEGIGHKIGHFFKSLTGGEDTGNDFYTKGVTQGGALLSVDTDAEDAEEVAALLKQHGAQVENDAYEQQTATPITGSVATSATGEVIPIVEEQLVVGKREVDRGGVRVFSRVVAKPVSADVTLRDEHVNVERRAVDRPATEADFQAGSDSFELRASGEEAVVGKASRVVEEIVVGKEATQHTQAIHDTVRKTEVEVEELAGASSITGTSAVATANKNRF